MYCGECGTKNEKESHFCENCGTPLAQPEGKENKIVPQMGVKTGGKKERKPMAKKTKIGIIVGGVVVLILIILYIVGSNVTNPKNIAKKYFEAMTSYDADQIYPFLTVEESDFVNRKIFKKLFQNITSKNKMEVNNYTIKDASKSSNGLTMLVTIDYTVKGNATEESQVIKLVKSKDKKYLIYDEWQIADSSVETISDFKVSVMKGSTLTIEGIKVNQKYIDKKASTKTMDVYKLPSLFPMEYNIKAKLPIGVTVEDKLNVNRYTKKQSIELDGDNLPAKEKTKIANQVKSDLTKIYQGIIDNKTFDEIKSSFEYKNGSLGELKKRYEETKESLTDSSTKLTKIEFKDIKISNIDTDEDGYLEIYLNAKYNYTIQYNDGTEQTKEKSSSDYMTLTYDIVSKEYHLVNGRSLVTYFSIYF